MRGCEGWPGWFFFARIRARVMIGAAMAEGRSQNTRVGSRTEQARLAEAGLAAVEERATTCCYAKQDKFWVPGAPGGERWEIYTVLQDSPTFWGEDGEQRWDTVQAELGANPTGQATQCCGDPQAASEDAGSSGVCCG